MRKIDIKEPIFKNFHFILAILKKLDSNYCCFKKNIILLCSIQTKKFFR